MFNRVVAIPFQGPLLSFAAPFQICLHLFYIICLPRLSAIKIGSCWLCRSKGCVLRRLQKAGRRSTVEPDDRQHQKGQTETFGFRGRSTTLLNSKGSICVAGCDCAVHTMQGSGSSCFLKVHNRGLNRRPYRVPVVSLSTYYAQHPELGTCSRTWESSRHMLLLHHVPLRPNPGPALSPG